MSEQVDSIIAQQKPEMNYRKFLQSGLNIFDVL